MTCRIVLPLMMMFLGSFNIHAQNADVPGIDALAYGLVMDHPDMKKVVVKKDVPYLKTENAELHFDVYSPPGSSAGKKYPAIIFLNALGENAGPRRVKSWGIYTTWPKMMAAKGYVGITMETDNAKVQESIKGLFEFIDIKGSSYNIDKNKLGVYAASANVTGAFNYLMNEDVYKGIKAAVFYYGFSPEGPFRKDLPVLYVVSESDASRNDYSKMWAEVLKNKAPWTIMMGSGMPHAFDVYKDNDDSRKIIKETISFWKNNLDPVEKPSFEPSKGREIFAALNDNPEKALAMLKEYTEENPGDYGTLNTYAHVLFRERKYDEAKIVYEKILVKEPGKPEAMIALAGIAYARNETAVGDRYVEQAVQSGNMTADRYADLAFTLLVANKNEESAKYYEKAVEMQPRPGDYYNLACAYAKNNDKEKALDALEKSVKMGYGTKQFFMSDADLDSIKNEKRFNEILGKMR